MTGTLPDGGWNGHAWAARHFAAPRWLASAHLQTLAGKFLRRKSDPVLTRERIDTPDGDFLDVDWMPETDPTAPLVLVLHGLEGHTKRGYMVHTFLALADRGLRAVALNFRGCSGEVNRAPRFYHSGETEDVGFVVDLLRERFPTRPLMAIGFSLGGNILLKYLGEQKPGDPSAVSAAVVVSVPYDLAAGAAALEQTGMARIYSRYFLRSLLAKVREKKIVLANVLDLDAVWASATLRDFDDAATAKLHGFTDAEDYYQKSSSNRFISSVGVPTLIIHSRDDPFLPIAALPLSAIKANPFLNLILTDHGGHVGFFEGGPPWNPSFGMEDQSASFLAHHHRPTVAATPDATPIVPTRVDPNTENI